MEKEEKKVVDIKKIRRKRKKDWKKKLLVFLLLCFSVFILLFSPLFNITSIDVVGNAKVTSESIVNSTGLYIGQNIFRINKITVKEKILLLPYVESVKIQRKLPNKIHIEIKEKAPIAAIEFMGSNIFIDENEYILESLLINGEETSVPHITGFNLSTIVVGEKIKIDNIENLQKIIKILHEVKLNGYINEIKDVYIDANSNIILNTKKGQQVIFGDELDADYKVMLLKEIMIKEQSNILIDISDIDKPITRPI